MRSDFLEFKKYLRQAITRIPDDSFFKQSAYHKFKHSIAVLNIGRRIMLNTPELKSQSQTFMHFAQIALLFHDVGRFEEAIKRYHTPDLIAKAEVINQYDHCLIGYEILKNNIDYNDIRILLAVRYHGKMMSEVKSSPLWHIAENSPLGEDAKKILYLVRDADKLANLKQTKNNEHLKKDLFFKLLSKEALSSGLSPVVKQQFFAKQTILSETVYSFADRILMVLSWIFDLNYQKTKQIFKQNDYGAYLINLLAQYHQSPDDIREIKQFLEPYI